jgi:peptidoglycan/LPS O-acetylase OafA/YrhL
VGNFYARRALRIWPIYYLVVLVTFLFGSTLFRARLPWRDFVHYLTFTQNVPFAKFQLAWHPALRSFWTLMVEEQFYLFWPPLVYFLRSRWLVAVLVALVGLGLDARYERLWYNQLVTHIDAMALGALMAVVLPWASNRGRITSTVMWLGLMTGIAPFAVRLVADGGRLVFALDLLFFNATAACVIGLCQLQTGHRLLAPLRWRPLAFLGVISYGVYVFHRPIFLIFARALGPEAYASFWWPALYYAASIAVAIASWFLIEEPILRLKERFRYQMTPTAVGKCSA